MPDLSKCVKDRNGNYWCLDGKTRKFYRIILEEPLMVPREVIGNLLEALDNNENLPEEKDAGMESRRC